MRRHYVIREVGTGRQLGTVSSDEEPGALVVGFRSGTLHLDNATDVWPPAAEPVGAVQGTGPATRRSKPKR